MKKKHRYDLFLIAGCLLAAGALWLVLTLTKEPGAVAVVEVDGAEYGRYALSEEQEVRIASASDGYNVVVISDGKATVSDASCPDKLCVRQHAIDAAGETIVCLPNKLVVRVEAAKKPTVDLEA